MEHLTSLFLAQSYSDAWETYKRSLKTSNAVYWDYVILTASNELQAEGYRCQLKAREDNGFLPKHTHFAVIADPDGKRVGSGGATLSVIRYIAEQRASYLGHPFRWRQQKSASVFCFGKTLFSCSQLFAQPGSIHFV